MPLAEAVNRLAPWRGAVLISAVLTAFYCGALEVGVRAARVEAGPGAVRLGFLTYDAATYWANARALWRDRPGVLFPNPYDLSPAPPRLYFQLHTLVAGGLWRWGGMGPAVQEIVWRLVLGFVFLMLLDVTAGAFFDLPPGHRRRRWAHLVLAAGGGVAALWTLPGALGEWSAPPPPGVPARPGLLGVWLVRFAALEDGRVFGRWLMSPARQFLFVQELYFHSLFFGAVAAALRRRWGWALAGLTLAWLSHPFTAVHLGAVLLAAVGVEILLTLLPGAGGRSGRSAPAGAFRSSPVHRSDGAVEQPQPPVAGPPPAVSRSKSDPSRSERNILFVVAVVALLVQLLGLAYYQLYLPRFEVHRSVEANFKLPLAVRISTTSPVNLLLASGVLAVPAAGFVVSREGRWALRGRAQVRLAVVWAVVTILLVIHQVFPFVKTPVQPLHFSRGYLYAPVALLGLAGWWALFERRRPALGPAARSVAAALLMGVLVLDTAFFYIEWARGGWRRWGAMPWMDAPTAEAVAAAAALPPGIVFTVEPHPTTGLGYLLPTLTNHRSVLAHGCNTPALLERTWAARDFWTAPAAALIAATGADYVIVDKRAVGADETRGASVARALQGLTPVFANDRWEIRVRPPVPARSSPLP
ncbi:MAG: hypothetical protein Kow0059_04830 [Candidatus Sumerlaeia bacterium]